MVVDLVGMVRIVSEPEPVETVDLGAVIAQALDVLHPHIAARQVQVDVTAPLPAIPGQATKLRHVVANLIGNAIRFVPTGTGAIGRYRPPALRSDLGPVRLRRQRDARRRNGPERVSDPFGASKPDRCRRALRGPPRIDHKLDLAVD
jgi:signal transduction histidine kinase